MILSIVKYGDPVLRVRGEKIPEVTPEIEELVSDMLDTMYEAHGVGLAAQQVGRPLQLALIDVAGVEDRPSEMWIDGALADLDDWMPLVMINPVVELTKERVSGTEGCLSFPDITSEILRSARVKVTTMLIDGSMLTFEATGLLARAVQHEHDHLQGILFIDRMSSAAKASLSGRLKRLQKS